MSAMSVMSTRARGGVVLVIVLWTIALLSTLAMATALTFRGFTGIMAIDRGRVQSDGLLTAGLEVAAGLAASAGDKPLTDVETSLTLSSGTVHIRIDDEGGRIDIGKAPPQVLASLLRSVGAPDSEGLAQQIVTLRKRDAGAPPEPSAAPGNNVNPPPPSAAPTAANAAAPPVPESPFTDVGQLMQVPGMRADWIEAIKPLTTVFGNETVNPLTAPAEVLAVLPGVDPGRLAGFLAARRSGIDPKQLAAQLGAQAYVAIKPVQAVSVHLAALVAGGVRAGADAVIVCLPDDRQPYRVLVWTPLRSPVS